MERRLAAVLIADVVGYVRLSGEHQRIVRLEERFACTECSNRGGNSLAVFRLDRND